ncbi:MAG: hypothetical protein ACNA8G_10765 [Gammaproteobacteria bacterium]
MAGAGHGGLRGGGRGRGPHRRGGIRRHVESLGDLDDDSFGAALGLLWAAAPSVHLQAQARYEAGEISTWNAGVRFAF